MGHFEGYNEVTVYVDDDGVKWTNSSCTVRYVGEEDKPLSLIGGLDIPDQSEEVPPLEVTPIAKKPVRKRLPGRPRKIKE